MDADVPSPCPQEFAATCLQAFEAGKSDGGRAGRFHGTNWGRDAKGDSEARFFVDEQKIPADMEWDEAEFDLRPPRWPRIASGFPLATGRLLETCCRESAKIGPAWRVVKSMRGQSRSVAGVLEALMQAATGRKGKHEVVSACADNRRAPFYARAGFQRAGARCFEEAGHNRMSEMVRTLVGKVPRPPSLGELPKRAA